MISGSIQQECERRLINLYKESHKSLLQTAKRITKNTEESECLVQELYEYLHKKCSPKLWYGDTSYNIVYCFKFLNSRWINKTKKLNRISYVEEIWDTEIEIPYDSERDLEMERAHQQILDELKHLSKTKMWASSRIFELYWMSDKTLDEVSKDIGISKSTTFLAVKKIRRYLNEVIQNPYDEKE